jgi:hypothetical protein
VLCLVALLGLSSTADAQERRARGSVGVRFDVHLNLGYWGDFGAGFRVDIPIIPDGFLSPGSITDDFSISPGIDLFFWDYYDGHNDHCHDGSCHSHGGLVVAVPVMAQWNLYITPKWSIFPEAGVVLIWGEHWRHRNFHGRSFIADFTAGFGARYHFSDRNTLLMRVVWPAGFQIGITF